MMDLARIVALEALPGPMVRLRFADGAEGTVHLAPLASMGGVFTTIAAGGLRLAAGGTAVIWPGPEGAEADMDADTLRWLLQPLCTAAE